jgi:thiosulfate dehydrogenase
VAETIDPASIARGGKLYDHWIEVKGAGGPSADHPMWSMQTANTRTGEDTYRCKECHGWDYKGKDGAYATGSHYTGFPGVYQASAGSTVDQLKSALQGKGDSRHDFTASLGEAGVADLASFLKEGLFDHAQYVNYSTKKPLNADAGHGNQLFSQVCAACHGSDGKRILFDGTETMGFLANDNPFEVLHKIRNGQPDSPMPSAIVSGWSVQDAVDVLSYAQTLPK